MKLIVNALELRNNQTVIDLGAGDGAVIFAAAEKAFKQKLNVGFIAVDINPVLILIMYIRRLFHRNRKNIRIVRDDIFRIKFDKLHTPNSIFYTFYLYISPWYLERVIKNLELKIKNFAVISYMYPVKSLKKTERIIKGLKHDVFCYNVN